MKTYHSFLKPFMDSFVRFMEASLHWNSNYEYNLHRFDAYICQEFPDGKELRQEMIDSWCRKKEGENGSTCNSRINVVIAFVKYLNERQISGVAVPQRPKPEKLKYIPHPFTDQELHSFFWHCDHLSKVSRDNRQTKSRRLTIPVIFRLLYSSGIRTVEARMLKREDVDLKNGVLNIKKSKGNAQHYVALHDSITEIMRKYDASVDMLYPTRVYFFPSGEDTFYTKKWLASTFQDIWKLVGSNNKARPYDFRHHYTVCNINRWLDEDFDFNEKLMYLSKSMGHSSVESTAYYYSLVPRLAGIIKERSGKSFDEIVPEVTYEEK